MAYEHPECYDDITQELMDFLNEERMRRAASLFCVEDIWSGAVRRPSFGQGTAVGLSRVVWFCVFWRLVGCVEFSFSLVMGLR